MSNLNDANLVGSIIDRIINGETITMDELRSLPTPILIELHKQATVFDQRLAKLSTMSYEDWIGSNE